MIREAVIQDEIAINKLGNLVNCNYHKLFKLKEILAENYAKIYVYCKENKIIGFIHINILYETVDIINLVVDKNFRNQNVATNLLNYLIKNIPLTADCITLEVNENNTAALNLYKKFGFEIINYRKNYYENADAYLMGRRIRNE